MYDDQYAYLEIKVSYGIQDCTVHCLSYFANMDLLLNKPTCVYVCSGTGVLFVVRAIIDFLNVVCASSERSSKDITL